MGMKAVFLERKLLAKTYYNITSFLPLPISPPPHDCRNYFAFVVRDGAKYQCYVFLETGVPAATIVTTIQRMLAPEPSKKR